MVTIAVPGPCRLGADIGGVDQELGTQRVLGDHGVVHDRQAADARQDEVFAQLGR